MKGIVVGRMLALALATTMTVTALPTSGLSVYAEESTVRSSGAKAATESAAINFENVSTELYVGSDWAGANASVSTSGTKAVITASNFGWANSEWAIQYMLKNLGLKDNETYTVSVDLLSETDKSVFVKLDDSGLIAERVDLKAGETYHYEKTANAGAFSNNILYFALGQFGGETVSAAGAITLENLIIRDSQGNALTFEKQEPVAAGKEHDFSATEENAAYDAADPGLTKEGYDLIWSDEFDGNYGSDQVDPNTGLDLDNWSYQLGDGTVDSGNYGWGNNELESYTNRSKNLGVNEDLDGDGSNDGVLRITAAKESGYSYYASESAKSYSSARIRTTSDTEALFTTTYGYVEARIALPATQGAWPAFWMLPESTEIYGNWPVSGEIDILETCGAFTDGANDKACGTLHWGTPSHVYKGSGYVSLDSDYTYFHTYAIDWEPGKITWLYDGQPIYTSTNWESAMAGASDSLSYDAPFDMPFYMILNLAVDSGQFGGSVNAANFDGETNMYVDYVRCFQKTEGYADSVTKSASSTTANDWADYAGSNQIADITADNVKVATNGDMNSLETAGTSDSSAWYLAYQSDAADASVNTVTDANGKTWAKVGVNSKGSQDYSVQLIGHYDAKANYVYKVSFDAYADGNLVGQTVNCDSKEWKGWSTYGITSFTLKNQATSYSYLISQEEDFEDCRIEFNLGAQNSGNVYISNVKVEIVDPACIAAEDETRSGLADGNLIYNGTFDQGNNHTGYWSVAEGSQIKVPRYTTEKITDSDISVVDVAAKTNYEKISDGVKYYERRAELSAEDDKAPTLYQAGFAMPADQYTLKFDLYSKKDTKVTAAVYATKEVDGENVLDKKIASYTTDYSAVDGLKNMALTFTTTEAVEHAALVLRFDQGASVQIDNVSLYGKSQAKAVDSAPMGANTTWAGDDGNGNGFSVASSDGVYTASNLTSGGTWYSPQIISNNYALVAGKEYKFSFEYKLTGTSNKALQYIIQENGGSWYVYNDGPTTVTYDATKADSDGFCTYEVSFKAGTSLDTVHTVFGLGNSSASGANFMFRNVKLELVSSTTEDGQDTQTWTDTSSQPEETNPEVTEPEITEPEITEPEITEPEITEPEITDPEVTDPEVIDPVPTEKESAISNLVKSVEQAVQTVKEAVQTVKAAVQTVNAAVQNVIKAAKNIVKSILKKWF